MPKLSFTLPHTLGAAEAKDRLNGFMPRVQEHYKDMIKDLDQSWTGDTLGFSFKTMGMKIAGTLAVSENAVATNIDLPLAAMMVKGKIEQELKGGLERILR